MKVYVASSWRNLVLHREVVERLREAGHETYDFTEEGSGFSWSEVDPNWRSWDGEDIIVALQHPRAREGFKRDMDALQAADACVLVMPCNRSAHLELGYAVGASKFTIVLLGEQQEAELMWSMVDAIVTDIGAAIAALRSSTPRLEAAHEHAQGIEAAAWMRLNNHQTSIANEWDAAIKTATPEWGERLRKRVVAAQATTPMSSTAAREAVLRGHDLPLCTAGCGRRVPDSEARAGFTCCEHCVAGVAHD